MSAMTAAAILSSPGDPAICISRFLTSVYSSGSSKLIVNGTLFASSHVTAIESIPHGCVKGCVIGISSASVDERADGENRQSSKRTVHIFRVLVQLHTSSAQDGRIISSVHISLMALNG